MRDPSMASVKSRVLAESLVPYCFLCRRRGRRRLGNSAYLCCEKHNRPLGLIDAATVAGKGWKLYNSYRFYVL